MYHVVTTKKRNVFNNFFQYSHVYCLNIHLAITIYYFSFGYLSWISYSFSLYRGDHSSTDCNMAILPPQSEAVVFSIDSSFLSSISLSGINPKIRGGAVDAVRYVIEWMSMSAFVYLCTFCACTRRVRIVCLRVRVFVCVYLF